MAALLRTMITTAPRPDRATLLNLEREARRKGSGIQADQLQGCWKLQTTWNRSGAPSTPGTDACLRALDACLILTISPELDSPQSEHLQIENRVQVAGFQLSFQGAAQLKGNRPLLFFSFNRVQLKVGDKVSFSKAIDTPSTQRLPFFALIHLDPSQGLLIARGRGGGLALWNRRSIESE
ncbi:hypothetical protein N8463_01280 [Synechococcus sp. AH-601-P06]|nr:hypothetical protein [Synechococcus sp. AH-601-O20]MDA7437239.1 hypothetical protein [Synechococcus sp. AH-601-P06]